MDYPDVVSGGLTSDQIQQDVRSLGKWFHIINLNGIYTALEHFPGDYQNYAFAAGEKSGINYHVQFIRKENQVYDRSSKFLERTQQQIALGF